MIICSVPFVDPGKRECDIFRESHIQKDLQTYLICHKDIELEEPLSPLCRVNSDPLAFTDLRRLKWIAGWEVNEKLDAELIHLVHDWNLWNTAVGTDLHVAMDGNWLAERLQLQLMKDWTDMFSDKPSQGSGKRSERKQLH